MTATSHAHDARQAEPRPVLRGLNDAQRAAAAHAAAAPDSGRRGTGETATLAHRVARLVAEGVPPAASSSSPSRGAPPRRCLRRVDGLLRSAASAGDLHASLGRRVGVAVAAATRLLRIRGKSIGLPPGFTILDRADSEDLMHAVPHVARPRPQGQAPPRRRRASTSTRAA